MALIIVRNDITKMEADAIVNSTNPLLQRGGFGVDAAIHAAAGPRLREALDAIGGCPEGEAVVTDAFDISTCRYIIHAVPPVYLDGSHGEEETLRRCYRNILRLAWEKGCRSLAVPSLAAGANAFPRADAYRIATSCIREYLFGLPDEDDMQVYLVLFSRESVDVGEKIDAGVRQFITDADARRKKEEMADYFLSEGRRRPFPSAVSEQASNYRPAKKRRPAADGRIDSAGGPPPPTSIFSSAQLEYSVVENDLAVFESPMESDAAKRKEKIPAAEERFSDVDLAFADMCEWWCRHKGISKKEFYSRANINRSMFWNMKHHPEQFHKKPNVLACAVGLGLDLDQTQDLLMRAGLTLSKYYEMDLVVEYFIREGNHDIDAINGVLFDRDLPLLGSF